MTWVVDEGSIRQCRKVSYSQVYAYLAFYHWQGFRLFILTGEDNEPLACFVFDSTDFDLPFDGVMQLDFDAADLGQTDTAIMRERKSACLRIGKRVVAISALEAADNQPLRHS